jgi:hypothetical protein
MGVHDHHISAEWTDLLAVVEKFGDDGFVGGFPEGLKYRSTFDWEKYPGYCLSEYFDARLKEDFPLSADEQTLCEFVRSFSGFGQGAMPPSDLPVPYTVFRPERVRLIAGRLTGINLENALEYYECVKNDYRDYWPKERILAHLRKVIQFWTEAATEGRAVLYTLF